MRSHETLSTGFVIGLIVVACSSAGTSNGFVSADAGSAEPDPEGDDPETVDPRDAGSHRDARAADARVRDSRASDSSEPELLACGGTAVDCYGECVFLLDDPEHCGGCDNHCPVPANGSVACVQGVCAPRCPDGHSLSASGTSCEVVAANITPMLALGADHTCGLTAVGAVRCWGSNIGGLLGNGTTASLGSSSAKNPTPGGVIGLNGGVDFITAGSTFNCATTASGAVKCWGQNDDGQLGLSPAGLPKPTPVLEVTGLGGKPTSMSAGTSHACAVVGGGAKCWGWNQYGQLGDGTTADRTTATPVSGLSVGITAVLAAGTFSCALTSGGAVKCWGENSEGLGATGISNPHVPFALPGLAANVIAIDAGFNHVCALLGNGAVKCFGANTYGQLGDGTNTNRDLPADVPGLGTTAAIALGGHFTCALSTTGVVRCFGKNNEGNLGDGTTTHRNVPTVVTNLSGATHISAGGAHACARTATGLRCWGRNYYGQLADGTTSNRTAPVSVTY